MGQNVDVITVTFTSTSGAYVFDSLVGIGMTGEVTHSGFAEVIAVCLHGVRGQFHVMEHAFKFDRELEAAFDFEFGKHASFRIIRYRSVVKEALCKVSLIISLEDVLLCDKPK
jgi:hypothetical protein